MEAERATAKQLSLHQLLQLTREWKKNTSAPPASCMNFSALMADPRLLPADHQLQIPTEGLARTVADYIAGMTDTFIEQLWLRHCPQ